MAVVEAIAARHAEINDVRGQIRVFLGAGPCRDRERERKRERERERER